MSLSGLGTLPGFGSGSRSLSGKEGAAISSQLDLDDALGSLLGESSSSDTDKKRKHRDKTNKPSNSRRAKESTNDTDFYSQLANQAGDSLDDSEDMVDVTPVDTKKMADSVDVDNMEASLFGSFSRSQTQRRQSASHGRKNSDSSTSSVRGTISGTEATTGLQKDKDVGEARPQAQDLKPREKSQVKKSDFDDDILDLLSDSDSEDKAPKKRVKPKIQIRTKRKQDVAPNSKHTDSKPITSSTTSTAQHIESDTERPKTSHGRQSQSDTLSAQQPTEKSNKADILKLDSTPEHTRSLNRTTNNSQSIGESFNSTRVDFGDEDDDILSGMGLDDSSSRGKATVPSKQHGSKLDDLLGKKNKSIPAVVDEDSKPTSLIGGASAGDEVEEDGFQFGGYLPSAATDGSTAPGPKLPSTRRRNSDSLTFRPSSAPGPAKKSVRFAEGVEDSTRPSSSPATNEAPIPAIKDTKKSGPSRQTSKTNEGDSSLSKKPPLPRKNEPVLTNKVQGERQGTPQSGGRVRDESIATEGGGESLAENSDSLFPWDESTPKHSSSRIRGRRSSQQKSVASTLFEDSQEQPEGDEKELHSAEEQTQKPRDSSPKLERPTFPWQKGRQTRSQSAGAVTFGSTSEATPFSASAENDRSNLSTQPALDQSSLLASFQEQMLQQQRHMQEQLKTLQTQPVMGTTVSTKGISAEEEQKLKSELKSVKERVKETEKLIEQQKTQLSDKQVEVEELQLQVQSSEKGLKQLEEEYKVLSDKMNDLENSHQKSQLELTTQLDELKMKLYKVELERDQLKQLVESTRAHHSEEMESVQKSHETRIKAMEESFQRREARWREEAEMESIRYQERLQQLEKEKTDVSLALKKKLDALEVSKTNEIGRLQDIHYSSIEDLKREHELDKQHLLNLHRQEVEALKAAHSHTRMLSDLSRKVESSTREVSQLQAKLENTHSKELQEQAQRAKTHEEQLKVLEERLLRQQTENSAERERLQSLIAKLEVHISQQRKQIEQERWQLQQENNHLKIQRGAFEEERISSMKRIEEDREQLQQAKERFLTEQREVLTKCYEERRALATERAEVTVLQKRMKEKEQRESQKSLQAEAEFETTLAQIREESARVTSEAARLKHDQETLRVEKETFRREKERLEALSEGVQTRSQEIEDMHQSALIMRDNGEQALFEAQKLQEELTGQSRHIQAQWLDLREKETRIATELLSIAHQKRELQHLRMVSRSSALPDDTESVHSLEQNYLPPPPNPSQITPSHSVLSLSHLPPYTTASVDPTNDQIPHFTTLSHQRHHHSTLSQPHTSMQSAAGTGGTNSVVSAYSPRASPVHTHDYHHIPAAPLQRPSAVKSTLAAIEQSRSLRNLELDARKDKEDLEEENEFLESLQVQNNNVKQLVW